MTDILTLVADTLNREYQSGGDVDTLVRVATVIASELSVNERAGFADVATMGGLPFELTDQ